MFEETGIIRHTVGPEVAAREFVLQLNDGEHVLAEERFFLVRVDDQRLSRDRWTAIEIEVMTEHRWWSADELASTSAVVFPEGLIGILRKTVVLRSGRRQAVRPRTPASQMRTAANG